ncbi:MAG: hypothetical protein A2X77_04030 [Gammaproteobacteria bacterium GWE2_42_36]|nr:MAG: hypothetical protein A2X77_04030 [Gammaproteobacteria bacterium GWE2_42_36]HCU05402.1 hypothetical protein [Coxiellaceae bacterium]
MPLDVVSVGERFKRVTQESFKKRRKEKSIHRSPQWVALVSAQRCINFLSGLPLEAEAIRKLDGLFEAGFQHIRSDAEIWVTESRDYFRAVFLIASCLADLNSLINDAELHEALLSAEEAQEMQVRLNAVIQKIIPCLQKFSGIQMPFSEASYQEIEQEVAGVSPELSNAETLACVLTFHGLTRWFEQLEEIFYASEDTYDDVDVLTHDFEVVEDGMSRLSDLVDRRQRPFERSVIGDIAKEIERVSKKIYFISGEICVAKLDVARDRLIYLRRDYTALMQRPSFITGTVALDQLQEAIDKLDTMNREAMQFFSQNQVQFSQRNFELFIEQMEQLNQKFNVIEKHMEDIRLKGWANLSQRLEMLHAILPAGSEVAACVDQMLCAAQSAAPDYDELFKVAQEQEELLQRCDENSDIRECFKRLIDQERHALACENTQLCCIRPDQLKKDCDRLTDKIGDFFSKIDNTGHQSSTTLVQLVLSIRLLRKNVVELHKKADAIDAEEDEDLRRDIQKGYCCREVKDLSGCCDVVGFTGVASLLTTVSGVLFRPGPDDDDDDEVQQLIVVPSPLVSQ